jgi:hypothetical protein
LPGDIPRFAVSRVFAAFQDVLKHSNYCRQDGYGRSSALFQEFRAKTKIAPHVWQEFSVADEHSVAGIAQPHIKVNSF